MDVAIGGATAPSNGLVEAGVYAPENILAVNKGRGSGRERAVALGLGWAANGCLAASQAQVVILCVKPKELGPLLERPGEVVDREELFQALEQRPDIYAVRRLETRVSRLRGKLNDGDQPDAIETVRGVGYRMRVR